MSKGQGIIDGIVNDVIIEAIIAGLIHIIPWLGSSWATPILSWLVAKIIRPLFEFLQQKYNIIFINWAEIEKDKDYQKEVDNMKGIVKRVESGELDENSEEVKRAREAYKQKLRDLIRIPVS